MAIEVLPIGLDGPPLFTTFSTSEVDFRTIINCSNDRWSHRTHSLGAELDICQFLIQDRFSDSTVRIVSALVYRQCFSIEDVVKWLCAESRSRRQIKPPTAHLPCRPRLFTLPNEVTYKEQHVASLYLPDR